SLSRQSGPAGSRPVTLPDGSAALLIRGREWVLVPQALQSRRAAVGRQVREANLLWRLERHGVAGPRVLAAGTPRGLVRRDSFGLVEPFAGAAPLWPWLDAQAPEARSAFAHRLGVLVARLHEGCCHFRGGGERRLAVWHGPDGPIPVIESGEGIR